ncbi:MAG: hypothetical protein GC154_18080 [bacterium]|nr:hypothetical protein [bacterium]
MSEDGQEVFFSRGVIYHRSCEDLAGQPPDEVALTVTSPPYWNAIDYARHDSDPGAWYRTREGGPYCDYLDEMEQLFGLVKDVTRPGGFCAIVIGTVLFESRHYPVPHDLTARLQASGWEFHQDIVWNKVTGGVKRARVVIKHPYPGYYYPNIMTESILIFRKPGGEAIYRGRGAEELKKNRLTIDDVFKRDVANNVWHIAPIPPKQAIHPCAFPEEIPYRLIQLYSYKNDLVLDPFMGIGSTPKVASALERRFIGYEILESYFQIARRRIEEPLYIRKRQLIARFGQDGDFQ